MTTTQTIGRCPSCQKYFEETTSLIEDATPKAGDVTVCIRCGAPLVIETISDSCVDFRALSSDEIKDLPADFRRLVSTVQFLLEIYDDEVKS